VAGQGLRARARQLGRGGQQHGQHLLDGGGQGQGDGGVAVGRQLGRAQGLQGRGGDVVGGGQGGVPAGRRLGAAAGLADQAAHLVAGRDRPLQFETGEKKGVLFGQPYTQGRVQRDHEWQCGAL